LATGWGARLFRNREIRLFAALYIALASIGIAVGFAITLAAGILALLLSAALGTAFLIFTKARYRSLARISNQIDTVLHGADSLELNEASEGELSILYSEITKMTLRIREQNEMLRKDRQYLADSLADIAHQLRTPLTSANLILSFLAKEPSEHDRQGLVRELEGLLVRMDWLITSLLKISRLDAGVVEFQDADVGVKEMIQSALMPLLIPLELRGIAVEIDVSKETIIQGDLAWLSEAVQNVLKNCMENSPENGSINISCTDNNFYTEIIIHDSGPGFDADELPRLFDRFYCGKGGANAGYGIGLALCKIIISRQGGSVTARNHPQGGAMFAMRFPKRSRPPALQPTSTSSSSRRPPARMTKQSL
jgi:signal transduction histidine kinase